MPPTTGGRTIGRATSDRTRPRPGNRAARSRPTGVPTANANPAAAIEVAEAATGRPATWAACQFVGATEHPQVLDLHYENLTTGRRISQGRVTATVDGDVKLSALVALDFLGFGLPAPTPSWGELIGQGMANLTKWWLVFFPLGALFVTLLLVVFIGEAIREAFDPKEYSRLR